MKLAVLIVLGTLFTPAASQAGKSSARVLKVRNRTPFIVNIYVAKIRVGWVRPFRLAVFKGLKKGSHTVYAVSHYGFSHWGPRRIRVPGMWNLTPSTGTKNRDMETALAHRVYRRNRSALMACDKLAERRGEVIDGTQVDFEIKVSKEGKGAPKITGKRLSRRRAFCLRSMASQWKYPVIGAAYTLAFQHHR